MSEQILARSDTHAIVRRFVHDEEDEYSRLWDSTAKQQRVYHYALYETVVDLLVDLRTGQSQIVAVDGRPVSVDADKRFQEHPSAVAEELLRELGE